MTVKELLSRIDSPELTEWMAYYRIEPWGEVRADYRSGVIASTLANCNRGKGTPAYSPLDFMPFVEREKPQEETLNDQIKHLFGALDRGRKN